MKLILAALLIATPLFFGHASACTCTEYGTPACAAYWRSDAVFVGHLTQIRKVAGQADNELPLALLHFIVEQPFRGVSGSEVDITTLSGTSCDMSFKKGERWLIYATRDAISKRLFAGPCTRTTLLEDAEDDLTFIRNLNQQGANESVVGKIVRNQFEPLPDLKVVVEGADKKLEATTDEQGMFKIPLPGPGVYTVRAFVPFAAAVLRYYSQEQETKVEASDEQTVVKYELNLSKNQCDYRELDIFKIDLHATAEISGTVLTTLGEPVNLGYIYLISADNADHSVSNKINEDGTYKIEGVAAGRYFLVVNPRNEPPDENDAPYPRTYYPAAAELAQATPIVVAEDAKLKNLELRVGPQFEEREVAGRVVWSDGRTGQNAHVSLYNAENGKYIRLIKTNEKGKFSFKVFGDFKYEIEAAVYGDLDGRSERVKVPSTKSRPLKLVLKRK